MVGNLLTARIEFMLCLNAIMTATSSGESPPNPYARSLDRQHHPELHFSEEKLLSEFEPLLTGVNLQEIAVPAPGRPIRGIEHFDLVPVVHTREVKSSGTRAGYNVSVPEGIRLTYSDRFGDTGMPHIDSSRAIGLVYQEHLIAVSAAEVDQGGRLTVVQIQDVTSVKKTAGKPYYETGLHNGMLWRDTLVKAWEALGHEIGATGVAIQSNQNSFWTEVRHANGRGYDDLAQRLGYTFDEESKNWFNPKPI